MNELEKVENFFQSQKTKIDENVVYLQKLIKQDRKQFDIYVTKLVDGYLKKYIEDNHFNSQMLQLLFSEMLITYLQ